MNARTETLTFAICRLVSVAAVICGMPKVGAGALLTKALYCSNKNSMTLQARCSRKPEWCSYSKSLIFFFEHPVQYRTVFVEADKFKVHGGNLRSVVSLSWVEGSV